VKPARPGGSAGLLLGDDLAAQVEAGVADVGAGSEQLVDLLLGCPQNEQCSRSPSIQRTSSSIPAV
jgi:hypothetical protein